MKLLRLAVCILGLATALVAAEAPKKVLVVSVTTGFRHSSIATGEKVLGELATKSGKFTVDFIRQPTDLPKPPQRPRAPQKGKGGDEAAYQEALKKFEADDKAYWAAAQPMFRKALEPLSVANLKKYDAVLFLNTTGDLPLPDPQGFVSWVESGKGFIGIHSATDTFHKTGRFQGFPPYTAMIGGAFRTHGPQVQVDVIRKDAKHPASAALPATWTLFDEIYEFKDYDANRVHALASLDKHPQTKADGHNGIAWVRAQGKGRVFYTSLGHREDIWDPEYKEKDGSRKNSPEIAKQYQTHVLNGILWALGLEKGEARHAK